MSCSSRSHDGRRRSGYRPVQRCLTLLATLLLVIAPASLAEQAATAGRNVLGIHTLADSRSAIDAQLTWARSLVGVDGHVTQPFFGLDEGTQGPAPDAEYFVEQAYTRSLDPILVL